MRFGEIEKLEGLKKMKPVLKYPGAKNRIAPWIVSYIPRHEVYLEPFFGSGAVLFNKQPSRIETVNDIDGNIVNFFKVLRDNQEELIRTLKLTPYARDEYIAAYQNLEEDSKVEQARKFAVRCWMGFGCSNRYQNGFRTSQQMTSPDTTKQWNEFMQTIREASLRLKNVQIENMDAMELIKRYNTADVFIYIDPPYLTNLRKGYIYKHEMTEEQHIKLLEAALNHSGKVMISGYESEMYAEYLKGWNVITKSTQAERGVPRKEVLWMNYIQNMQMNINDFMEAEQ